MCVLDWVCVTHWQLVQEALQHMKPGSAVRLQARLPFLGHDPTGMVARCPVEIHIKAAVKQHNPAGPSKIFTPALSSQRHALALQVSTPSLLLSTARVSPHPRWWCCSPHVLLRLPRVAHIVWLFSGG